jgi:hypothetical protein
MRAGALFVAACFVVGAAELRGAVQGIATKILSKADAEFEEPFTNVAGVRELSDGRVVVVDPRDKVVQVIDFKTGNAVKVGREGSGPGEYAIPTALVALPGDTSGVYDPLNRRLLLVLPNGKAGAFANSEVDAAGGAGPGMRVGGMQPRWSDARGRLFAQGSGFRMTDQGPQTSDSAPVTRFDRAARKMDTIAFIQLPKNNAQVQGGRDNMQVRIGGANPFAPRDEWAVANDGRVAIVTATPEYRVVWIAPDGKRTTGPAIAYDKIRVSDGHKQEWRDQFRRTAITMSVTNQNGRTSVSSGPPPGGPPEPSEWPELLPPFLQNAARVAPNGQLWVLRTREARDDKPTFDVFDGAGRLVSRVQLPPKTRLAGFGNGTAYIIRTDDDDLQYLQRFKL